MEKKGKTPAIVSYQLSATTPPPNMMKFKFPVKGRQAVHLQRKRERLETKERSIERRNRGRASEVGTLQCR